MTERNDTGQTAYKRQLAYRHLGINPKDVQYLPFVARQLRRISRRINQAANKGDPSDLSSPPVRALDYLRSSEDPEAQKVVNAYFSVPESYRRLLPLEAFCHAAGVSPLRVLECITVVAVRQGAMASAVVAAVIQPDVVAKLVNRAIDGDDFAACKAFLKATGFLPGPGW